MNNKLLNIIGIISVITTLIWAHKKTEVNTMNVGIKLENLNTEISAGNDFYEYATGGWQKAHPIPDDYVRYGVSEVLYNTNLERIKQILENDDGKIGTLYKLAMNTDKLAADGTKPVQKYLDAVDSVTRENLESFLGNMHKTNCAKLSNNCK
jgi:putative endopeptidase